MSLGSSEVRTSLRRHLLVGLLVVFALVFGVGGWAYSTYLSGAVLASGAIVVDGYVKPVQHSTGGVVSEVAVKNGDLVKIGDVLVRLNDTQVRANLAIVEKRIVELMVRQARLTAEMLGDEEIIFEIGTEDFVSSFSTEELLRTEVRFFETRRASRTGQEKQLRERVVQLEIEIAGLAVQIDAQNTHRELIEIELVGVRDLQEKGLVPDMRSNEIERELARLQGERGVLIANKARAAGQIAEIELQILGIETDLQREVSDELNKLQAEMGELAERRVAAADELQRMEVRAPQDGIVHRLIVHAAGAVLSAAEPVLVIVPIMDDLVVEVRVSGQDIDQLALEQTTSLRFSAFDAGVTPEIIGTIQWIDADLTVDPQSGASYYLVRIFSSEQELSRLGDVTLLPGMPVEAFIQTQSQTVLSYLIKPLADQFARAFRES